MAKVIVTLDTVTTSPQGQDRNEYVGYQGAKLAAWLTLQGG